MPKTPKTERVVVNKMTHANFFKLCNWLKDADLKGINTGQQLADKAVKELTMPIAVGSVRNALEVVGRQLENAVPRPSGDLAYLADQIAQLMRELGKEPEAELLRIAKRKP